MILKGSRPVALWAIFIFCLHIIPSENLPKPPDWGFSVDKVVHFFLFAILAFLLLLQKYPLNRQWKRVFLVVITSITFGLLMETIQLMVPGRDYNMVDLFADGVGAVFGCLVFGTIKK